MAAYKLTEGLFLYPTPAGAYYAVCANELNKPRQLLRNLLQEPSTPPLDLDELSRLSGLSDPEENYELLYHCQKLQWLQGVPTEIEYPSEQLEIILPNLLGKMSESGNVLLADMEGFQLACHGFTNEIAEELSALNAELAMLHERRSELLVDKLGLPHHSWGIIDVFGNSQIGFWPFYIGDYQFVIIISGVPHFNQPEFVDMIWALSKRYGS